jgi:cytochrome c556
MTPTKSTLIFLVLVVAMLTSGGSLAFSFDFGDDDDKWRYYAYQGHPNQPWIAPNGMYFYPRLPYFQRQRMIDQRQDEMASRANSLQQLGAMLYGNEGFDRARAIKMARSIEATSGEVLADKFHPGSVVSYDSNTTLTLWGSPDAFRARALQMQISARALAEELEKQPTAEEGAVFVAKSRGYYGQPADKVAVSPGIWEKFNTLSAECAACHREYRGYGRW